jgi:hypothetical protein
VSKGRRKVVAMFILFWFPAFVVDRERPCVE